MNLKFTLNEYILIWNLLFKQSISKELNNRKQKIWINYKKEYNALKKENINILKDSKNYIPNDDTIYNIMKEQEIYNSIYKYTNKYKLELTKVWDEYQKEINKQLKSILKISLKQYNVFIIDPRLNTIDYVYELKESNCLCYGRKKENSISTIIDLIFNILKKETSEYNKDYQDVVDAVLELCILNELATRLTGRSHYLNGDNSLNYLKKQIYPYFLMYLGIKEEDMTNYMKRDGILFDRKVYPYQEEISKMDLYSFIDFCVKNQKYIVKIEEIELI